ncbi:MAG TPA: hypothetical protein PKL31_06355 [Fulvivirga sp.]|nr:hypothetical protein [Fulvivirga sp.]
MKHTDEQIDKIIHDALSKEEAQFYDQLGEQNILDMSLGVFQGKNKGFYVMILIVSFVIFGFFIFCAIEFYNAETTRDMLIYGAMGGWAIISVGFVKIWHWLQMNTNSLLREIKRLELQIAAMAAQK